MKVLIVDDFPGAAESMKRLLQLLGHECHAARNGQAALSAFASFEPEVVLLDIGLPDISGYDVARAIRARTSTSRRVFIAALTGLRGAEVRARAVAAEIDLYVEKPATRDSLENVVGAARAALADA